MIEAAERVLANRNLVATGFNLGDMHRFAREAWGPLGTRIVSRWQEFNRLYFDGVLKPIPLVVTQTQPYGKSLGLCSQSDFGRTIQINVPRCHNTLVADNGVLLHEMIHQLLHESGEYPKHDGAPWRREIMRLHSAIRNEVIWAGQRTTQRRMVGGVKKPVAVRHCHPKTGQESLGQMAIATWPGSLFSLGAL